MGLFLIGYRQTIGARKERTRSTNLEVEKILLRRLVLESWLPDKASVMRLIEGKARDYRVSLDPVTSADEALGTIFTRVFESDFITPEQRKEILTRLAPVLEESKQSEMEQIARFDLGDERMVRWHEPVALLAAAASTLGATATLAAKYLRSADQGFKAMSGAVAAAFVLSILVVAALAVFIRFKEPREEGADKTRPPRVGELTREVAKVVGQYAAQWSGPEPDRGYDFAVSTKEKKILIEVKPWRGIIPSFLFRRAADRLRQALTSEGADEAIIVTRDPVRLPRGMADVGASNIKIMTAKEMRKYLAEST